MDVSSPFYLSLQCKRKQEDFDATSCKRLKNSDVTHKCSSIMTQEESSPSSSLSPVILSDSLMDNFQRSGLPRRFMFYKNGEWIDYPNHVLMAIAVCFMAHKTCLNFSICEVDGTTSYTVNFVCMLQLNMNTGYVRSVAWIDDHGKCFSPSECIEGSYSEHQGRIISVSSHGCRGVPISEFKQQRVQKGFFFTHGNIASPITTSASSEEVDSCNIVSERDAQSFAHELKDRVVKLDEADDKDFEVVKGKFVRGLSLLAKHTTVSGIYKISYVDTTKLGFAARLKAFQEQERLTKELRGDANVRLGWHGTSKEGVKDILLNGFKPTRVKNGASSYGVGVYLSPEDYPRISAMYSNVDENGEQHMILSKVVLGKSEQVHPRSHQLHPSSDEYDTAVDELEHPKRYIVWSTHMNTRVLPEFVITFKLSPPLRAVILAALGGKKLRVCLSPSVPNVQASCIKDLAKCDDKAGSCKSPCSPWMSFPELFSIIRPKLNPKDMLALQQHYFDFRGRKMPRHVFVKKIRSMVGDDILRDCLVRKNNS